MGAAEHQRVDLGLAHRREQPFGEHVDLVGVDVAGLDELHETGARRAGELDLGVALGRDLLVRARRDGADGADHPDPTRSAWP